ncbi:hypothetical protein LUR56_17175 [Streptomyces sp. MT29]|nr:hypothetical protein [Streptomyces sp. MT29]
MDVLRQHQHPARPGLVQQGEGLIEGGQRALLRPADGVGVLLDGRGPGHQHHGVRRLLAPGVQPDALGGELLGERLTDAASGPVTRTEPAAAADASDKPASSHSTRCSSGLTGGPAQYRSRRKG